MTTHRPSRTEGPLLSALPSLIPLHFSRKAQFTFQAAAELPAAMSSPSQDHVSWQCTQSCLCSFEQVTLCDLVFVRAVQLTCSAGHRVRHNLFVESLHSLNTKKLKEHKFFIIYLLTSPRPIVYFGGLPMPWADRSLEPLITFLSPLLSL